MDSRDDTLRQLTGSEHTVSCNHNDEFTGVTVEWLLPKLRLNPACSPWDGGISVFLDGEELCLTDSGDVEMGARPFGENQCDGKLIGVECGEYFYQGAEIIGHWLHRPFGDGESTYEFIPDLTNLEDFALTELSNICELAEPYNYHYDYVSVTSDVITSNNANAVETILSMTTMADSVTLNDVKIK